MSKSTGKVGSDPAATRQVVGDDDFGVAADEQSPKRQSVSDETRTQDPGKAHERSGTGERTSGVGGPDAGRGSSSGGDVETGPQALVGIGDPHQHPPHGSVEQMQSPVDPKDRPPLERPIIDRDPARAGHRDSPSSDSAADVQNEAHSDDDAFRGDLTADEAGGS